MFGHTTKPIAGYECIINADGTKVEHDLKKCVHCGVVWRKKPGSGTLRGFCCKCSGDCCSPECSAKCYPHEQQIMDESKMLQTMIDNPFIRPDDSKLAEIFNRLRGI